MRMELARFDLIGRGLHQLAKLPALLLINGCPQMLDLRSFFRTNTTKATWRFTAIQE